MTHEPERHESDRKKFSATEARQGFLGKPVLKVLGASLALVVLVWIVVELWGDSANPDSPAETQQTTPTTNPGEGVTGQQTFDDNPPAGETQETVPTDTDPTPQTGSGGDSQQTTPDGTQQ